jgi:hypothetical protein
MEEIVKEFAITVLTTLGPGHSEAVYHNAMDVMFRTNGIKYASEVTVPITFMGCGIGFHRLDTVLYSDTVTGPGDTVTGPGDTVTGPGDTVTIIEYKSIARLKEQEENQVRAYLRATGYAYGILVNFGTGNVPEIRRVDLESSLSA